MDTIATETLWKMAGVAIGVLLIDEGGAAMVRAYRKRLVRKHKEERERKRLEKIERKRLFWRNMKETEVI